MPNDMNEHIPRVTISLHEHDELLKVKAKYERLCEALLREHEEAEILYKTDSDTNRDILHKCADEIFCQMKEYNPDRFGRMKKNKKGTTLWTS